MSSLGTAAAGARRLRASAASVAALIAATGVAAAAFVPGWGGGAASAQRLLASTSGGMELADSKPDSVVVSAADLIPGGSAKGRVEIGVLGQDAQLSVTRQVTAATPGAYGGDLTQALEVTIERPGATKPQNRVAVYSGTLAAMPRVGLGRVPAGRTRRYRITVALPNGGVPPSPTQGDNALQGSRAEVEFVWSAR